MDDMGRLGSIIGTLVSFYHAGRAARRLSVPAAPEVTMAKFRFPGKALKLNTRKRVRFRGSHAAHTPEELYTRRIRKGLDLFTQIFGDSDEVRRASAPPPPTNLVNMAPTPPLAINSMQYNPFQAGPLCAPVACCGAACSSGPRGEWWAWAGRRLRAGRAPVASPASSPASLHQIRK